MATHTILFGLKALVSVGLIALLLSVTDLKAIPAALERTSMPNVMQGLFWLAIGVLLRSYKWHLLVKLQCSSIPLKTSVNLTVISMFFNNFFLGTLGGDAFRALSTAASSQSVTHAASSVIMDRLTGIFTAVLVVFLSALALIWNSEFAVSGPLLSILALLAAVLGALFLLLFSNRTKRVVLSMISAVPRLNEFARNLWASFRVYGANQMIILYSIGLSLVYYVAQGIAMYCFAAAVGANVSFFHIFFISVLVGLLVMIPISLNGLGIQEGSYALYLARIGVAEPQALVIVILLRASVLAFGLLGAGLFLGPFTRRLRGTRGRPSSVAY